MASGADAMTSSESRAQEGMTTEQIHTLQHSLGIDRDKRVPWRNHYCAEDGAPTLEALVALGLMVHGRYINDERDRIYHVTPEGTAVAIAALPEPRTRSQRRYLRFLSASDAYSGLTFREFLRMEKEPR